MDGSYWKIRLAFAAVCAFLFSAYFAYEEFYYWVWGRTVQAQLVGVSKAIDNGARGRSTPALAFQYSFDDGEAGRRTEPDVVPTDWPVPEGNTVQVRYVPGEKDASRLAGHNRPGAVAFFFICLAVAAGFIIKLAREANEPIRGSRRPARSH